VAAGGCDGRSEVWLVGWSVTPKPELCAVSDVDRAKQFYERLGWRLDDDVAPLAGLRIVQFTPPGSGCSITFGEGLTMAAPGSAEGGWL
jgi:predicted enzyme related to lactoylglutathione lyase